jgi:hypothetical protein
MLPGTTSGPAPRDVSRPGAQASPEAPAGDPEAGGNNNNNNNNNNNINNADVDKKTGGSDADAVAAKPAPAVQAGHFQALVLLARRIVVFSAVLTTLGALAALFFGGGFWCLGVVLGGGLVAADALVFRSFVAGSKPGRLTKPLYVTVVKFYLVSAANIGVCFLVVKFAPGHPLGFLFGLLIFLPAAGVAALGYLFAAEGAGPAGAGQ